MTNNVFKDLQQELLGMCIYDRPWLKACGDIVSQDDFKPLFSGDTLGWLVSGIALDFYKRNQEPLGSLVKREIDRFIQKSRMSDSKKEQLLLFLKKIRKQYHPTRSTLLQKEVIDWKKDRNRKRALKELLDYEERGMLTDDIWMSVMQNATRGFLGAQEAKDWLHSMEQRSIRRMSASHKRVPSLMIDPLDQLVRSIGRGQLGMWLAAWKMGKSTALLWTAYSYIVQGYNVLYFTLEDPLEETEDRLDALISEVPIIDLGIETPIIHRRFGVFSSRTSGKLKIVDGTDTNLSVNQMRTIYEKERNMGFDADAIIIDYDDEIKAPARHKDRRFELADIYRELRQWAGKDSKFIWTAAQGTRDTEGKRVITGRDVAEDISKIRKCALCLGIGQGLWGNNSRYLNVTAHKFDRQHIGCTIWSRPESGCFYDQQKTLKRLKLEKEKAGKNGHL